MNTPIAIDRNEILKRYKPIDKYTHKGIQGHALLIGGSYGKIGAMCLSSKAALKTGCGLVTTFVPLCGYEIVQTSILEVMVVTDEHERYLSDISFELEADAIGIGPGMGQKMATQKAFHDFLSNTSTPLVIDADALNILSHNPSWVALVPPRTVLTPHPKELERLIGKWYTKEEMFGKTVVFSLVNHVVIVMKGAPTYIIDGETIYENTTGNAALATAGSGDVLTGMITSLLAQSYKAVDSALIGVYLHGLTADIALPETGYQSFIASDIIANIGKAYLSLED
ncbi:NAD(P)H-hydrate dehydratase [Flavobacterium taihuense]|uniref:ADP-dependent (S)-NAD(P)H-hydrate dehydratase n=1 Tax=Flavobacterium taihuense TaxID=2857508 RepID=A0ABS6XX34_9FLAO|nr:NAD(P)H-hydrate dehydratase [Flavobacterium taihuense]MBW4360907.1 NAD(P)H-hydrate dehydratase [Flavobacterium taihuense]